MYSEEAERNYSCNTVMTLSPPFTAPSGNAHDTLFVAVRLSVEPRKTSLIHADAAKLDPPEMERLTTF
jgi:hypothetical protein